MPYPYPKDPVCMLDECEVTAFDDVLLEVLAVIESDFFC